MKKISLLFFMSLFLAACDNNQPKIVQQAEIIQAGEECHLCGMAITHFPGPKGQVFGHGQPHSVKFCSTMDLFSWAFQPENKAKISKILVHDMTTGHWQNPTTNPYINAETAWYVWEHSRKGAMQETFASFKTKFAAQNFAKQYGGKVYDYSQIQVFF